MVSGMIEFDGVNRDNVEYGICEMFGTGRIHAFVVAFSRVCLLVFRQGGGPNIKGGGNISTLYRIVVGVSYVTVSTMLVMFYSLFISYKMRHFSSSLVLT